MSLANGRTFLAIPGPSVMPDAVLRAMHRASPNIYEGEMVELAQSLVPDLKWVAGTAGHVAMYICNGHGTWEAALSNICAPGDHVLVPATGRFGVGWADYARGLGATAQLIEAPRGQATDPGQVEAALRADTERRIKAVLVTHVDTATSVRNDIPTIRAAMDAAGHPALLCTDNVASLGCDRFEMDAWGVDVMISASQKGLMVPPGMGFVWFNDKAAEVRRGLTSATRYWDWTPRADAQMLYEFFTGTAPTQHLYGLRTALDMLKDEGLEAIWTRHARLARAVWAAVDCWGQGGNLRPLVSDPALRSNAVTALRIGAPDGTRLRHWCEAEAGVTLGLGLGMSEPGDPNGDGYFRFGHMGHVNAHMILGLLGVVEQGMVELGIAHGSGGVSAAAEALAASAGTKGL